MMNRHPAEQTIAGEVRALLAKRRKTATDLAAILGITPHTAGRRLSGRVAFTVAELFIIASWLDVPLGEILSTAPAGTQESA